MQSKDRKCRERRQVMQREVKVGTHKGDRKCREETGSARKCR